MKNRQAYMVGLNKMEIREAAIPEPKEGEVLVKVEYVGICGSDVHYFKDGRCGDFVVDGELMLGHEAGGVVVKVGAGVTDLVEGDKVALEPGITCGQCEFCKSGRYNLCPDVVFLATPPVQGCNEDYIAFPANMCFKLPEGMSTKECFMYCDKKPYKQVDMDKIEEALKAGDDDMLAQYMDNSMYDAAVEAYPVIGEIVQYLKDKGLKLVSMSGSGSTVFALSTDKALLKKVMLQIEDKWFTELTRIMKQVSYVNN